MYIGIFLYIFLAVQSVLATPLLMSPILYFERCLNPEPERCRSKQARYQLSNTTPFSLCLNKWRPSYNNKFIFNFYYIFVILICPTGSGSSRSRAITLIKNKTCLILSLNILYDLSLKSINSGLMQSTTVQFRWYLYLIFFYYPETFVALYYQPDIL